MVASEVVGFDVANVESWLTTVAPVRAPFAWTHLAGGHSNLTYLVHDGAGRELVIRRPPLGPLLPKAHDMWREYRIISGLWPSEVPVPEPVAYCDGPGVAETHFYVMGKSSGKALYNSSVVESWLDRSARERAGEEFVRVLAALHSLDPADVGLGDLGRPDGYVARQIKTWYTSWTAQASNAGHDDSRVHELHDLLSTGVPEQGPARLVHGDYGPHNALFRQNGEISAVLDWEIATLGDPLADLAYSVNAWVGPGDELADQPNPPTLLPGFPTRQDVIDRYVQLTGADTGQLSYYRVFNYWRRACILHGVYARYRSGQKSSEGVDLTALVDRINTSLARGMDLADELP
jgi:aminoglycoside phosphotransferase (APT) family kinase protein